MSYFPIELLKVCPLNEVKGPAIFWSIKPGRGPYLITGSANPIMFPLDGQYVGRGSQAANTTASGYAIEQISFEVDRDSHFLSAFVEEPVGALILGPAGVRISSLVKDHHGFEEVRDFPVDDQVNMAERDLDIGFSKWAAFVGDGDARRKVWEFQSPLSGNR